MDIDVEYTPILTEIYTNLLTARNCKKKQHINRINKTLLGENNGIIFEDPAIIANEIILLENHTTEEDKKRETFYDEEYKKSVQEIFDLSNFVFASYEIKK